MNSLMNKLNILMNCRHKHNKQPQTLAFHRGNCQHVANFLFHYHHPVQYYYQLDNRKSAMISWVHRCIGGMGAANPFEKARNLSTSADWSAPREEHIKFMMETFIGLNPQITAQQAWQNLVAYFGQHGSNKTAAFWLKNLFLIDMLVEQRVLLGHIKKYSNPIIEEELSKGADADNQPIRSLAAKYYQYIKIKARCYQVLALELVKKSTRAHFFEAIHSPTEILAEINLCFKIQNHILAISNAYDTGNRSLPIVQAIFASLLKTYLFCFSVVSLAIKALIGKVPKLGKNDLEPLAKLTTYFNKDYTKNLLLFIDSNKAIDNFKKIKYKQFFILDQKVTHIINFKIKQIEKEMALCPEVEDLPFVSQEELLVQKDQDVRKSDWDEKLVPLKKIQIKKPTIIELVDPELAFKNYQNFYSESFALDDAFSLAESKWSETTATSNRTSMKSRRLKSKISILADIQSPSLHKTLSEADHNKFDSFVWDCWDNVYCIKQQ